MAVRDLTVGRFRATGTASAGARGRRPRRAGRVTPYVFILPFVALFCVFTCIPLVVAAWDSLHRVQTASGLGFGTPVTKFVGLANFGEAFTSTGLGSGLLRVLIFGVVQQPIMIGVALVLTLLFDSSVAVLKRFFQLAYFLPYAIPGVVAALMWGFLYLPRVSPLVSLMSDVGLPVNFLSSKIVLWSIVNITLWQYTGVTMIVMIAAVYAIPRELIEAARVDGAGEVRVAWSVKVPLLKPVILLNVIFGVIGTLQLFNEPMLVRSLTTNITGNYTPNMAVYQTATLSQNEDLAAAMAVVLALIMLALGLAAMAFRRWRRL